MPENSRTVGISEMIVSNDINDSIINYSLGSCLGVTIYDPVAKVGGMIHGMLALSKIDQKKPLKNLQFLLTSAFHCFSNQLMNWVLKKNG